VSAASNFDHRIKPRQSCGDLPNFWWSDEVITVLLLTLPAQSKSLWKRLNALMTSLSSKGRSPQLWRGLPMALIVNSQYSLRYSQKKIRCTGNEEKQNRHLFSHIFSKCLLTQMQSAVLLTKQFSHIYWLMPGFGDNLCNKQDESKLVWPHKRIEKNGFSW